MRHTVQLDPVQSGLVALAFERFEHRVSEYQREQSKLVEEAVVPLRAQLGVTLTTNLALEPSADGGYTASWDTPDEPDAPVNDQ